MRTWLVTGASKGLGAAIARAALMRGDRVALASRYMSPADPIFSEFPDAALPITLDVVDPLSIGDAICKVEGWGGPIDVLVNNAGQGIHGAIEETSDKDLRALFDVNFFGVAATIRGVLPSMRARGRGLIINIGSVGGFVANPGTGAYCATKFALEALTEALRKEVEGMGIKVAMIAPGGMRTGFNNSSIWQAGVRIEAYHSTAGTRTDELKRNAGVRGSDVEAVAAAVWQLSKMDDPPSHLILGADAIERIDQKLSHLRLQLESADPLTEAPSHVGNGAAL
ncbi:SDR family NAD(P)-dependent oxidoreductase [Chelativorans sp.]|uniref:SDR family NAD(P)-dependent oxidoreductase n=1 Tax=Chelativorans sp. TaxID=2203393 RepID=UPI002810A08D|nr:SDR family NAD(P)-dependent oxidoreductase [Chelativorans sp.]